MSGSGNDDMDGQSGNDIMYGGDGDDILRGGDGNDTLLGGGGNDTLLGGGGNDYLIGVLDNDILQGGVGNDIYDIGSTATITEQLNGGTDTVKIFGSYALGENLENLEILGSGSDSGTGNALDNQITGNTANNDLFGNNGSDTLDGGTGADYMVGGDGNDTYIVDNPADIVDEDVSTGIDIVNSSVSYNLSFNAFDTALNSRALNVENLTLTGATAINGTGNALSNTIIGNGASNRLEGAAGNDTLIGGSGNDTLVGGLGKDVLTGGVSGVNNDKFVFDTGATFNKSTIGIDTITDFTRGADKIVLDKTTFTALSSFSFASVGTLALAQTSSARITVSAQ
jgi:Ca2+-binding RTX toxin-like protein